jgi:hypothetical protein
MRSRCRLEYDARYSNGGVDLASTRPAPVERQGEHGEFPHPWEEY